MTRIKSPLLLFILFLFVVILVAPQSAFAGTASDIQAQIDANKQQLAALEADIAAFQKQLDVLGGQKNTLQSTISSLTLSQKKLASEIKNNSKQNRFGQSQDTRTHFLHRR